MTDLLLAKPQLQDGFLDLSVGEASIIRNNLFTHFPSMQDPHILSLGHDLSLNDFEYLPPAGMKDLVQLLEDQHQAPVIIFNGAKQALGAAFYALKKRSVHDLYLQPIHWALLQPLAETHGLDVEFAEPTNWEWFKNDSYRGAYLMVAPGNPDGVCPPYHELRDWSQQFRDKDMPFIFDGAYYTHSYLPMDYPLGDVGDVQIYSFSKMLGLSAVRGGYCVVHNHDFYYDMVAYQEMMTVGVSVLTQKYLHAILTKLAKNPLTKTAFEKSNYEGLRAAKNLLKEIPKSILDVPVNFEETPGMFAFCKVHDINAFHRAKIHVVGGAPFGDATKVRLNLGVEPHILKECVQRLKKAA
jgi:aspartate/methionine/tyrosine aminotransferase